MKGKCEVAAAAAAAAARVVGCGDVTRSGRVQMEPRPPARSPLFTFDIVS